MKKFRIICGLILVAWCNGLTSSSEDWSFNDEQTTVSQSELSKDSHQNSNVEQKSFQVSSFPDSLPGFEPEKKSKNLNKKILLSETTQDFNEKQNNYQNVENNNQDLRSKSTDKNIFQHTNILDPISLQQTAFLDDGDNDDDESNNNNIRIAVQSKRRFEFVPAHFDREKQKTPRVIEIVSDSMPLRLHFKSQSAAIVVSQSHMSPPVKSAEETVTIDEPYRLTHKMYKPIIQNVNEIIQPYRNIVQQVKPVIEDIRTIVSKDNDINHYHVSKQAKIKSSLTINNEWSKNVHKNLSKTNNNFKNRFYSKDNNKNFDKYKTSETLRNFRFQKKAHFNDKSPIEVLNQQIRRNSIDHHNRLQIDSSEPEVFYVPRSSISKYESSRSYRLKPENNFEDQTVGDLYNRKMISKNRRMANTGESFYSLKDYYQTPPQEMFSDFDSFHHEHEHSHEDFNDYITSDDIDSTDFLPEDSSINDHSHLYHKYHDDYEHSSF